MDRLRWLRSTKHRYAVGATDYGARAGLAAAWDKARSVYEDRINVLGLNADKMAHDESTGRVSGDHRAKYNDLRARLVSYYSGPFGEHIKEWGAAQSIADITIFGKKRGMDGATIARHAEVLDSDKSEMNAIIGEANAVFDAWKKARGGTVPAYPEPPKLEPEPVKPRPKDVIVVPPPGPPPTPAKPPGGTSAADVMAALAIVAGAVILLS